MPEFIVRVRTTGYEEYVVVAEDEDAAWDNWFNGALVQSEVHDTEVEYVEEVED